MSAWPTAGQAPGAEAEPYCPSDEMYERYRRCQLLNVIQHIDIYGKFQTSYAESKWFRKPSPVVISMSSPRSTAERKPEARPPLERLRQLTARTRTCSLYPGHDILSKRRGRAAGKVMGNLVVPRVG